MDVDLSIIVPVYNTEQGKLIRCFGSIKKFCNLKSGYEIECIIVDDGSNYITAKCCQDYAHDNSNFKYLRKDNGGVSSARNYGLENSKGEYICFVDSDDTIEVDIFPDTYFSINVDLIFTDLEVNRTRRAEKWKAFDKPEGPIEIVDVLRKISHDGKLNGPCCKRIKRAFLERNNIRFRKDLISGEDAVFLMEMLGKNPSMYYIPTINYHYFLESDTSRVRLFSNVDLVINNNRILYDEMLDLICLSLEKGSITDFDTEYLNRKSTERYIKQIFNIASELSTNHRLNKDAKKMLSDAVHSVKEKEKLLGSKQSRFQYTTIVENKWLLVKLYGLIRIVYLIIKEAEYK